MRYLLNAIGAALLLSCAACTNIGPLDPMTTPAANTAIDEKLLYAAEAAYNVPAQAYVTADANGILPASIKAVVKPKLIDMRKLLLKAREAYKLGNRPLFEQLSGALKQASTEVGPLIPKS